MTNLEKTRFMNKKTFSEQEIKNYPYSERRTFCVGIDNEDHSFDNIEVYAVDEESLFGYLRETYCEDAICAVSEKIVEFIDIDLSDYL